MTTPGIAVGAESLAPWLETGVALKENGTVRASVLSSNSAPTDIAIDHLRRGDNGGYNESRLRIRWGVPADNGYDITFVPGFEVIRFDRYVAGVLNLSNETATKLPFDDDLHHIRFAAQPNSSNLDYQFYVDGVEIRSVVSTTISIGGVQFVELAYLPGLAGAQLVFGHLAVYENTVPTIADAVDAAFGHQGEMAGRRIERICGEEGIAFLGVGELTDSAAMGSQFPDTFLATIQEAEKTDLGVLFEPRQFLGYGYRTRASLYNQPIRFASDYGPAFASVPKPVPDDAITRNDVTVTRREGSSHQEVKEDGPLGVDTIGRYDTAVTVNTTGDDFLPDQAGWRLHLGTVDEDRFPELSFHLHNPAFTATLAKALSQLDIGDRMTVDNMPTWVSFDLVSQLSTGFKETLKNFTRDIQLNTVPEKPWQVGVYNNTIKRYSSDGSTLGANISNSATSLSIATPTGPLWSVADGSFGIRIGGEVMTVTNVTGSSSPQTFTVTRSVNGVIKAHNAGATMELDQPAVYAL